MHPPTHTHTPTHTHPHPCSIDLRLPSPKKSIDEILRPSTAGDVGSSTPFSASAMASSQQGGGTSVGGLAGVVSSLQEEYNSLSGKYSALLAQSSSVGNTPQFANELMAVMTKMKRKEDQIAALRQ